METSFWCKSFLSLAISLGSTQCLQSIYETGIHTVWLKSCGHLIITPIYGSFLKSGHKVGSTQLCMVSLYVRGLQFPFTEAKEPKPAPA